MNKKAHYLAVFGGISQVLIPISLLISQFRLHSALAGVDLKHTEDAQQVISSMDTMFRQMGSAVDFFLWALGFALLGLVFFIIAITRFSYRRNWAFWFSCIYGACLTVLGPIGIPFGLFLLIYALIHRQEFLPPPSTPATSPA